MQHLVTLSTCPRRPTTRSSNNSHHNHLNNQYFNVICQSSTNTTPSSRRTELETPSCPGSSLGPSRNPSPFVDNYITVMCAYDSSLCSPPCVSIPNTIMMRGRHNAHHRHSWSPPIDLPPPPVLSSRRSHQHTLGKYNDNKKYYEQSSRNVHREHRNGVPPPCYNQSLKHCYSDSRYDDLEIPTEDTTGVTYKQCKNIRFVQYAADTQMVRAASAPIQGTSYVGGYEAGSLGLSALPTTREITPPVYCPLPRASQSLCRKRSDINTEHAEVKGVPYNNYGSPGGMCCPRPISRQQYEDKEGTYDDMALRHMISTGISDTTLVHNTKVKQQPYPNPTSYGMTTVYRTPLKHHEPLTHDEDSVLEKTPCDLSETMKNVSDNHCKARDVEVRTQDWVTMNLKYESCRSPTPIRIINIGNTLRSPRDMTVKVRLFPGESEELTGDTYGRMKSKQHDMNYNKKAEKTSGEMKSDTYSMTHHNTNHTHVDQDPSSNISISLTLSDGNDDGNISVVDPSPICPDESELECCGVTEAVMKVPRDVGRLSEGSPLMTMPINDSVSVRPDISLLDLSKVDLIDVCDPHNLSLTVNYCDKNVFNTSTRCLTPLNKPSLYHSLDTTFNEYDDSEVVGMTAEGQLLFKALPVQSHHTIITPVQSFTQLKDKVSPKGCFKTKIAPSSSVRLDHSPLQLQCPKPKPRRTCQTCSSDALLTRSSCFGIVYPTTAIITEEISTEDIKYEVSHTYCHIKHDKEMSRQEKEGDVQKGSDENETVYCSNNTSKHRLSLGTLKMPPPLPQGTHTPTVTTTNSPLETTYGYVSVSSNTDTSYDLSSIRGNTEKLSPSPQLHSCHCSPVIPTHVPPPFLLDDVPEEGSLRETTVPSTITISTTANCSVEDYNMSAPQQTPRQHSSNKDQNQHRYHRNLSPSPLFDPINYNPPPPSLSSPISLPNTHNCINLQQAVTMAAYSQGVPPLPPIPSAIRKRTNEQSFTQSLSPHCRSFDYSEETENPLQFGRNKGMLFPYLTDNESYREDSYEHDRQSQFLLRVMEKANWSGRYQELLEVYENRENERPEEVQAVMEEMEFILGCLREIERIRIDEEITSWRW